MREDLYPANADASEDDQSTPDNTVIKPVESSSGASKLEGQMSSEWPVGASVRPANLE